MTFACSAWLCLALLALLGSAWLCLALLGSAWLFIEHKKADTKELKKRELKKRQKKLNDLNDQNRTIFD